jgi:hypothetical protein
VNDRIEDVSRDDLPVLGSLDDPVTDVAAGEQATRNVVPPHVVLEDPGVRTTAGDCLGPLRVLNVVEPELDLSRVCRVAP